MNASTLATPTGGVEILAERARIQVDEGQLIRLLTELDAAGARILSVQPVRRSLEDFFVEEMGASRPDPRWTTEG